MSKHKVVTGLTAMVVMVMDTATDTVTRVILKKRKPDLAGPSGEFGVGGKGFGGKE